MLLTKLNKPILSPGLIQRPDLVQKIEHKRHVPLVLVSAPAGFGKSVLVNQWINHNQSNYAWISLDESMNDSKIFIGYFIEMLKKAGAENKKKLKKLLEEHLLLSWEAIISAFINIVNEFQHKTILILDDYYLINNEEIHQLVEALVREKVGNLQLVIISRWDPPFKLSKLRLYQEVLEIRMRDLRFDHHEIAQLLPVDHSMDLSQDDIKQLLIKTEGWILAIRLVLFAKSVSNFEDKDFDASILTSDLDRLMLLISENIDPKFFRQMQLCALCDEFNEDLTDAICEFAFPDSCKAGVFLSKLKSLNFFLIPLVDKKEWYRFHHLVSDILKRQLERSETDTITSVYLYVSNWFADKGLIEKALGYAVKGKNYELACNLITAHKSEIFDKGQWWIVQSWLEKIPEQIRKSNPELLMAEIRICEETWKVEEIVFMLGNLKSLDIENLGSKFKSEYFFHLGHQYTFILMEPEKAIDCLEKSKLLCHDEQMFGARRELILAIAKQMVGDYVLALNDLDEIEKEFHSSSLMYLRSLNSRVFIHLLNGEMSDAITASVRFYFSARNCEFKTVEANSWYLKGILDFQTFNKNNIEQAFEEAQSFKGILNYRMYFDALSGLILMNSLNGKEKTTELFMLKMQQAATEMRDPKFEIYFRSLRARVSWHNGRGDEELDWAQNGWVNQSMASYFFLMDVPDLTKIRIVVSHGSVLQVKEALEVLEKVEASLSNVYNSYHLVDIELLKAIALLRVGNEKRAQGSLEKALLLAEKKSMIRPILEVNRVMPSIFSLIKATDISYRILVRLGLNISAVKLPAPTGPAVGNLTRREQEVVKLIANGLANKEVADQLHISTVTVKSHMTNVYRKLNVSNRTSMLRVIRGQSILS